MDRLTPNLAASLVDPQRACRGVGLSVEAFGKVILFFISIAVIPPNLRIDHLRDSALDRILHEIDLDGNEVDLSNHEVDQMTHEVDQSNHVVIGAFSLRPRKRPTFQPRLPRFQDG